MNVLSLFDGMSCGQIALQKAGVQVDNYYASEIKPHAIKVTKHNFPNTIHLGDVRNVKVGNLPAIDLIIGGSPCKGISRLNQNQEGLEHDESVLFWEYVRIYKELRKKNNAINFLLENTHGHKDATNTISEILGVNPISINSRLVSAQNRPRYYWTDINVVSMPKDLHLTTKHILDQPKGDVAPQNKVKWLSNDSGKKSVKKGFTRINPYPKSGCLTANGHKKWNCNYIEVDGVFYLLSKNELEWLQTIPAGYTDILTYDEAYDVIGDGWTVDVIAHIFSFLGKKQVKQHYLF